MNAYAIGIGCSWEDYPLPPERPLRSELKNEGPQTNSRAAVGCPGSRCLELWILTLEPIISAAGNRALHNSTTTKKKGGRYR